MNKGNDSWHLSHDLVAHIDNSIEMCDDSQNYMSAEMISIGKYL